MRILTGSRVAHAAARATRSIRQTARVFRMACRSRAVILLYHRVATPRTDPLLLCVAPSNFAAQLKMLRSKYRVLSLADLVAAVENGCIPERSVVLTFDDGYTDNLSGALPLLAENGFPATVFASGECLDGGTFFSDDLEEILLDANELPARIRLSVRGKAYTWEMGDWRRLPAEPGAEYWQWDVTRPDVPSSRHTAFREIFGLLRPLNAVDRGSILAELRNQAARPAPRSRLMTGTELRTVAQSGVMGVGVHARHHLVLGGLPPSKQEEEIVSGKAIIETAIGRPAPWFAYPFGSPWDVSPETVGIVRRAGFTAACANTPAPVDRESDLFWLPRCIVRDWTANELARRLEGFFQPRAETDPRR